MIILTGQTKETILRHFGLVKLNALEWTEIVRWLGPDAAALIGTIVCHLSISSFLSAESNNVVSNSSSALSPPTDSNTSGPNTWDKILHSVGAYITLAFLCLTSSLQPSIPNGVYYLVFLGGATWWALSKNIRNKIFARIFGVLAVFVALHVICLFLYQLQWAQEYLDPQSLPAR